MSFYNKFYFSFDLVAPIRIAESDIWSFYVNHVDTAIVKIVRNNLIFIIVKMVLNRTPQQAKKKQQQKSKKQKNTEKEQEKKEKGSRPFKWNFI